MNITLNASNQISVNGQTVTLQTLVPQVRNALEQLQANKTDAPIFIAGDKAADLGIALKILDRLRAAKYTQVSFELEQQQP